jgi:hypothetical protein
MEFGENVVDSICDSDSLGWSACHVMLGVGRILKDFLVGRRPTLILVFVVHIVGAIVS